MQRLVFYADLSGPGPGGGGGSGSGTPGTTRAVRATALDSSLTVADEILLVDTSTGDRVITLPTAAEAELYSFTVKKISTDTNQVLLDAAAAELVEGGLNFSFRAPGQAITIVSDGAAWYII